MSECIYRTRIYYEDTDVNGIVYHANYLKFFERARTESLNDIDVDVQLLADEGILFAVVYANINYKKPARLNDLIDVYATPTTFGRTSVTYSQKVVRHGDESHVYCDGEVKIVCINDNMRPIVFPPRIKELLA